MSIWRVSSGHPPISPLGTIWANFVWTGAIRPWPFFKAAHQAAYKNLPLSPDQAPLCTVALRCPYGGLWYAFSPRAFLFGADSEALRYNCRSRIIAVLGRRVFGLSELNYINAFGCILHGFLIRRGVNVFTSFFRSIGAILQHKRTEVGRAMTFLGIQGDFMGRELI